MFTPPPSPLPPPFDSEKESYFDIPTNDGDEEEGSDFDQTPYTDTLPSSKERVSITTGLTSAHHPPTPCQSRRRILIPLIAVLLVLVAIASRFNFSDNTAEELDFPPSDPLSKAPAVSTSTHLGAESTTSHAARRKKRGTTVDPVPAAIDKRAESSESPGASSLSPSVSPSKTLTSVVASGLGLSSASSSSTGSAAASSNSTSPAIPDPPFPVPTPFPQPFDTTFGFNFSTSSCQAWFSNSLLSNNSFRACRPFSLLLPASNQFFQAQNNLTLLTSIIGGTCDTTPSEDECVATMEWLTTEIQKETVCSIDISARNSIVLEALDGFLNYKFMKDAGCLVNARTNSYCFVDAVGAASTSDFYFYTLALGTPLPNNTVPSCSTCVQSLMNIYAGQANNTALEISKTYGSAAVKANAVCGAKYAQALSTSAAARRIVGVAWSGVVATLIGVLLTCL